MIICKVKALRSATQKNDGFGLCPCTACTFNSFCDRNKGISLGCSNGLNHRSALAHLRRDIVRRTWAVFSDLAPFFGEVNLKKNICGTPSAELKADQTKLLLPKRGRQNKRR